MKSTLTHFLPDSGRFHMLYTTIAKSRGWAWGWLGRWRNCLILSLCLVVNASGGTYYIDYTTGSDSNSGTSKSTPWKRCPGMVGFGGTYSHSAGDRFIFKGGVTWPRSVFQFHITNSGASGNPDYYGADVTWYNGGSFTKPIFDFENTVIPGGGYNAVGVRIEASYVTLDQIDLKRYRTPPAGGSDWGSGTINFTGSAGNGTIQYCIIRDWDNGGGSDGGGGGGIWSFSSGANIRILHNEFHCADIVNRTGRSVSLTGEIAYNEVHDVSTFLLGGGDVHDNNVHNLQGATDPAAHENAYYIMVTSNVYNNILHDTDPGCSSYYLSPGFLSPGPGTTLCYNNVAWNVGNDAPISIETEGSYPSNKDIKVFNNTVEHGSGWCIRVVARGGGAFINSLEVANNYCITTGVAHNFEAGAATTVTDHGTDLTKTHTQATADGATIATAYRPSTGDAINGGISMSSYFTTDYDGVSRPQGVAWDVGAYEFAETSMTAYGILTLQTNKPIAATALSTGIIHKKTSRLLTAIQSFVGNLATQLTHVGAYFQTVTGNLAFVGSIQKSTRHTLTSILSFIGSLKGRAGKALAGAVPFVGIIKRKTSRLLQSVLSFVGNFASLLSHAGLNFLSFGSNLSFVGQINRFTRRSQSSILSFIGLAGKRLPKALTAAVSFVGNTFRRFPRALAASIAFIGSLTFIRAITKALSASLAFIGTLGTTQALSRLFTAALSFTGTVAKQIPKSIVALLSFIGDLTGYVPATLQKTFTATLSFSGYIFQRIGKIIKVAVEQIIQVTKISVFKEIFGIKISPSGKSSETKVKVPGDIDK